MPKTVAFPKRGDALIAFKAIIAIEGLSIAERRIACLYIDRFNRKTGQCDSSYRGAAEFLGIDRRTAIRAMNKLVKFGLFEREKNGGYHRRNSYQPVWAKFRAIEATWSARLHAVSRRHLAAEMSPMEGQARHPAGDAGATQTCLRQPFKQTYPRVEARASSDPRSSWRDVKGLAKKDAGRRAERSWQKQLLEQFRGEPELHARVIEMLNAEIAAGATDAEMQREGAGLEHVLRAFAERESSRSNATDAGST